MKYVIYYINGLVYNFCKVSFSFDTDFENSSWFYERFCIQLLLDTSNICNLNELTTIYRLNPHLI